MQGEQHLTGILRRARLVDTSCAAQMMATNNVSCPEWMDWFHGGLQYQIEHHLYPDLPRHQLRAASGYVKPMCESLGIRYHAPKFFQVSLCCCLQLHM